MKLLKKAAIVLVVLALVGGAVWVIKSRAQAGAQATIAAQKAQSERKVPVLVETVIQRDLPIVVEGLGTVTPLATVTVRAQVDGRLDSVPFKEGAAVKKGDLLAQIDPRPFRIAVAQTTATLERDQAQQRNAKLMLERYTGLRKQDLVPQQQVDDQQTLVDQITATVGIDQALVDNARLQLDYSRVVSPIDGIAGIRQVDQGNLVHQADPTGIVVLAQLDPIAVIFSLPQDELDRVIRAFAQGPRVVEAWSRGGQTLLASGELKVIDNQINASTASIKLKALFDNPRHLLWPNQFVKARLHVESKGAALVVSAAAIQRGQQGTFVYVVGADHTAQLRPVVVDTIEGTLAVITSGLSAGEVVVIDGQAQLKPGTALDARTKAAPEKPLAKARETPAP